MVGGGGGELRGGGVHLGSPPGSGGRGGGRRRRRRPRGGSRAGYGRAGGGRGRGGSQLRHRHQLPQQRETAKLDMLLKNAKENGVDDLQMMEGSQAMEMEPELRCLKALLSPSTGIVDSHSFMLSLLVDAENLGTTILYHIIQHLLVGMSEMKALNSIFLKAKSCRTIL